MRPGKSVNAMASGAAAGVCGINRTTRTGRPAGSSASFASRRSTMYCPAKLSSRVSAVSWSTAYRPGSVTREYSSGFSSPSLTWKSMPPSMRRPARFDALPHQPLEPEGVLLDRPHELVPLLAGERERSCFRVLRVPDQESISNLRDLDAGTDPRETGEDDDTDGFDGRQTCTWVPNDIDAPSYSSPTIADPCLSQGGLDQNIYVVLTH